MRLVLAVLFAAAVVPGCIIITGPGDPADDEPDADPCRVDARTGPVPDARTTGVPDAAVWPDAAAAHVGASTPDARPWPDPEPCNQGIPDAWVDYDGRAYPDAALPVPDAQPI